GERREVGARPVHLGDELEESPLRLGEPAVAVGDGLESGECDGDLLRLQKGEFHCSLFPPARTDARSARWTQSEFVLWRARSIRCRRRSVVERAVTRSVVLTERRSPPRDGCA